MPCVTELASCFYINQSAREGLDVSVKIHPWKHTSCLMFIMLVSLYFLSLPSPTLASPSNGKQHLIVKWAWIMFMSEAFLNHYTSHFIFLSKVAVIVWMNSVFAVNVKVVLGMEQRMQDIHIHRDNTTVECVERLGRKQRGREREKENFLLWPISVTHSTPSLTVTCIPRTVHSHFPLWKSTS